jgi:hypothetical protein
MIFLCWPNAVRRGRDGFMKTPIFPLLFASLLLSASVFAQENPVGDPTDKSKDKEAEETPKVAKPGFWEATLAGGNYIVGLDKITSVSRHKYLLDGALVVDEVTIDTVGQGLARFYYITPVGSAASQTSTGSAVLERGKTLLNVAGQRSGMDLDTMVVKKYPETTHARTIEYRLDTETQLKALFESASTSWQNGRGGQFKVQAPK